MPHLHNETVIESIKGRIEYLKAIEVNNTGLFNNQHLLARVTGRVAKPRKKLKAIILRVNALLESRIKPIVENFLSRRSAREHFDQLRLQLETSIRHLLRFLFYVLRDHEISPHFLLEEIRQPTLPSYLKTNESVLKAIFLHLVQSDAFTAVFPTFPEANPPDEQTAPKANLSDGQTAALSADSVICDTDESRLVQNDFLDQNNVPHFPKLIQSGFSSLTIKGCAQPDTDSYTVGIFPEFRTSEHITHFLALCGYIQRLCVYYLIANEFFDLAGEGGNILVYGIAAPELRPMLDRFKESLTHITQLANKLYTAAASLHQRYEATAKQKEAPPKGFAAWRANFTVAIQAYDIYKKALDNTAGSISDMNRQLERVNSLKYQQFVINKIARLKKLLRLFTASLPEAQAASPTSSSSSSSSSSSFPSSPPSPVTPNASSFFRHTTQNNIESQLDYIAGLLRNGGLFDRLEARKTVLSALEDFPENKQNKQLLYFQAKIQDSLGEIREAKKTLETLISLEKDETMLLGIKLYYQTIVDRLAQADELMHTRSASTASFTS